MTEYELSRIWSEIEAGKTVKGWTGMRSKHGDTVVRHKPHNQWRREPPNGKWTEVEVMPDLNWTWNQIAAGNAIEGWGIRRSGDRDYLTQYKPHRLWERTPPNGQWTEARPMGDGPQPQQDVAGHD